MSARQRFEPQTKKNAGGEEPAKEIASQNGENGGVQRLRSPVPEALKDASNSPFPMRPPPGISDTNSKTTEKGEDSHEVVIVDELSTVSNHKPLNIGSLIQGKSKNRGRKPTNLVVSRVKKSTDGTSSRMGSPRSNVMSPGQFKMSDEPQDRDPVLTRNHEVLAHQKREEVSTMSPRVFRPAPNQFLNHHAPHIGIELSSPERSDAALAQPQATFRLSRPTENRHISPHENFQSSVLTNSIMNARRAKDPGQEESPDSLLANMNGTALHQNSTAHVQQYTDAYDFDIDFDTSSSATLNDMNMAFHGREQHQLRRSTKRIGPGTSVDLDENSREGKRQRLGDMHGADMSAMQDDRRQAFQTPSDVFNDTQRLHPSVHLAESTQQGSSQLDISHQEEHALYRLFGVDLDAYLVENVEIYEDAKKRWTGCTLEDWQKGSDELSQKFAKTLDFVKSHMATKLSLFASLHTKVNEHKIILAERNEMLADMQQRLVKDSGTVLGGKQNMNTFDQK